MTPQQLAEVAGIGSVVERDDGLVLEIFCL